METIKDQVRLPWSVAFEVVLQGIRIRLGRSLVTLSGVALGTAFLMSLLSASSLRQAVQGEIGTREEVQRMLGFLRAETGRVESRNYAVLSLGPTSPVETEFLEALGKAGAKVQPWSEEAKADVVVVVGPVAATAPKYPDGLPIVFSRREQEKFVPPGRYAQIDREKRPEEIAREADDARKAKVRSIWIATIALLVTVMSICNALLMSVTERFREIGTMKCLGALSSFIRRLFFIESGLLGSVGSFGGALGGLIFSWLIYSFTFGFGIVAASLPLATLTVYFLMCWAVGLLLSVLAAIYPAHHASSMVPATALRSDV